MKRDMDNLNLRDAFRPMPEETRNALMSAARSVKEDEPVKKATFRTVLIAACIMHYYGNHGSGSGSWKYLRLE